VAAVLARADRLAGCFLNARLRHWLDPWRATRAGRIGAARALPDTGNARHDPARLAADPGATRQGCLNHTIRRMLLVGRLRWIWD